MTIKQFKWVDRDQAARDLLQLVYHAPSCIRLDALGLLRAIRSQAIIPELNQIVFDTELGFWERAYALRAIAHTPGDIYMLELSHLAESAFVLRTRQVLQSKLTDISHMHLCEDLLNDIALFVERHPSNRQWFWHELEYVQNENVLSDFLLDLIMYHRSPEFRAILVGRLLTLFEEYPQLLTGESTLWILYSFGGDKAKRWLNRHLDLIAETCCIEPFNQFVFSVVHRWRKLGSHLSQSHAGFDEQMRQYRVDLKKRRAEYRRRHLKSDLPDFRLSPAYRRLERLYQLAQKGHMQAYEELTRIATQPQVRIPVRAAATHFLGRLHDRYNVTHTLLRFLFVSENHLPKNWGPLWWEAGEALLNCVSPLVWERMVESFFHSRQQSLDDTLLEWIAYHTDRLSGNEVEYGHKPSEIDQRIWFRALAEIPDDNF